MANGNGCIVNLQGGTSDGEWVDDQQHGYGKETWDNGRIQYTGNFHKGQKVGRGRYEWSDGSYYEGDFENGMFSGHGIYFFADSDKTYEGDFNNNHFQGKGKLTYGNGNVYNGHFDNGLQHGQGTMSYANGDKYIGAWQNDMKQGIGIWYSAKDSTKKQGEWNNDKRTQWLSKPIRQNGENNKILS